MLSEHEAANKFDRFLQTEARDDLGRLLEQYPDNRTLEISYQELFRYNPSLAERLRKAPKETLQIMEESLRLADVPVDIPLENCTISISGLSDADVWSVGDYRTGERGEYIAVSGQVSRRTGVKPRGMELAFECKRCGTLSRIPQPVDGRYEPHECQGCERQGPFDINFDQSEFVDHQTVRLQRPPESTTGGNDTLDVHLSGDLAGELDPGDRVDVAGLLEMMEDDEESPTFEYYLDGRGLDLKETSYEDIEIAPYMEEIEEIAADDPFKTLIGALAPKVHGYEHLKEAIILQLFDGVRAEYPDDSSDRGSIHILLLGDPGVAKSKLLRAADAIAPRSTFASGKGTTAAGLTAGVESDDFGGSRYSLKAGALVQANEGLCCIDELDKVDEETRSSLHTALEQQQVEVNKILSASMPARTSLLAAGNPQYGRFDPYEPIGDQVPLGPALLSRFDLLFMIRDEIDAEKDQKIAEHVIESNDEAIRYTHGNGQVNGGNDDDSLIDSDIDVDALRAYIAHARQSVFPTIEDPAVKQQLKKNFLAVREMGEDDDQPVPVTFRTLEGTKRLAQASARVRLSSTIEIEDVKRAQRLVGRSMRDVGMDPEEGKMDADIIETGTSKSQRDRIKSIKSLIKELESEYRMGAPHEELIDAATDMDISREQTEHEINKLKRNGQIYEPDSEHYRTS